jgi:hypothetical protein
VNNKDTKYGRRQRSCLAANPNILNVNKLKTLCSNPKADIHIFYGDHTKDSITAKFMFDHIKIAQATYHCSDGVTA